MIIDNEPKIIDIANELKKLHNPDNYVGVLAKITHRVFTVEEAKCIFIHLAKSILENKEAIDIVLVSWGLISGFEHGDMNLKQRHEEYKRISNYNKAADTLNKDEFKYYKSIARACVEELSDDFIEKAISLYYKKDLPTLSFVENISKHSSDFDAHQDIDGMSRITNLKRTNKISSISIAASSFAKGLEDAVHMIHDCFNEGVYTQIIGGADGSGKTRLALKYAHYYRNEYQIVCWINAWNEDCIISSILKFFKIAKIEVKIYSKEFIKKLFLNFFEVNTNWLIIFDNSEITISRQKEILEEYIPSNHQGKIIITANICSSFGEYKTQCIEDLVNLNKDDFELFFKNRLNLSLVDQETKDIISLCNGNLTALTYITAYIHQSNQADSAFYLRLLAECDIVNCSELSIIEPVSFELLMQLFHRKYNFCDNKLFKAVEQLLIISKLFDFCDLDISFLNNAFPSFPDPLGSICRNIESKGQLISILKDLGIVEMNENILHYNYRLKQATKNYFNSAQEDKIRYDVLKMMETSVMAIKNNYTYGNSEENLIHAKPYINQALSYFICMNAIPFQKLKNEHSELFKNSDYNDLI